MWQISLTKIIRFDYIKSMNHNEETTSHIVHTSDHVWTAGARLCQVVKIIDPTESFTITKFLLQICLVMVIAKEFEWLQFKIKDLTNNKNKGMGLWLLS